MKPMPIAVPMAKDQVDAAVVKTYASRIDAKNFGRSTSATLLCVVWRRFDRLELIAFRVCGKEEPGTSCGRTKWVPRALLSHHKLLGNLFWIFGLNLERAVSSSERILCSRAPNLGVLCTPDRPPPFCLVTCQRSRTSRT